MIQYLAYIAVNSKGLGCDNHDNSDVRQDRVYRVKLVFQFGKRAWISCISLSGPQLLSLPLLVPFSIFPYP